MLTLEERDAAYNIPTNLPKGEIREPRRMYYMGGCSTSSHRFGM